MAQPGILSSQIPPGEDHVMRALADIRRDMRELGPSIMHSFQSVVDELAAHQATLDAQQATLTTTVANLAANVAVTNTNVANIAANVASINTLITQVVEPQSIYATTNTYVVTTTETTRASVTVTVPAGFTAAVVNVMGRVDGRNGNTTGGWDAAGGDLLHTRAVIAGVPGLDMDLSVLGSGDHDVSVMPLATVLPGLTPGGTFVLAANVWSEYQNWPAHAKNIAEISGTVTWYR